MELIKYPNVILLRKSTNVPLSNEVKTFVKEMMKFYKEELKWGNPVGLAAPQVGKNWNIFIALGDVYLNPEIVWRPAGGWVVKDEGCYSLDENRFDYKVKRQDAIKLKWMDLKGKIHEERFYGIKAQVIQHELDHLHGKLCCGECPGYEIKE